MDVKMLKMDEIKPYEKNPRKNDKAVDYVMASIKEFGFKVPIVIDSEGVIVAGHTRYKASIKLGLREVPCIIADDLTEDQIKAFRLADNKVSELALWDAELLESELQGLFGILDMNDFGFPVQIEDINEDQEGLHKISPELGEANNYVVLQFFTELDWERAITLFGLEKMSTSEENVKVRRHGIGRVIDGVKVLDMVEGKE